MTRTCRTMALIGALCGALTARVAADGDPDAARRLRRTHIVEVVEKTRDSVVNISTTQRVRVQRPMFGFLFEEPRVQTAAGSGFVIHKDGYIVTNDHVVAQSADSKVRFASGRQYDAVVVASDAEHDLAVLKIQPETPLAPLKLGRSDDLMVGEDTVAIGNPFGLENTVTRGVISAVNRTLEFDQDVVYRSLIQTDASINPGNSGGPLLNAVGELIGVNTAIRPQAENVGFAIPVDQLRALLPNLLNITNLHQIELGLRVAGDQPRVTEVEEGSPADKAGLRVGDVLTEVDNEPLARDVDFYIAVLNRQAGDNIPVKFLRDGKEQRATVTLTRSPAADGAEVAWQKLGLRLKELSPELCRALKCPRQSGLIVDGVDPKFHGGSDGIGEGDLLVKLGSYNAWPLDRVGQLLRSLNPRDPVDIEFLRFYSDGGIYRFSQRLRAR